LANLLILIGIYESAGLPLQPVAFAVIISLIVWLRRSSLNS